MKIFGYALCAFVILSFGSALAANDCCWDWDPKSNGADDGATAPPVKEVKESDYPQYEDPETFAKAFKTFTLLKPHTIIESNSTVMD